jgi:molybdopterin molybdotransferase
LDEAQRLVLEACSPLDPVDVPIDEALGRVLAAPFVAAADVPPFANSAMDGYALRAADTAGAPVTLGVLGAALAGNPFTGEVGAGQAVAIATGAAVPEGADAVCMIERAQLDGDVVLIETSVAPGEFVRPAGDDIARGSVVFGAGEVIGPAHVGVLASLGSTAVRVAPQVRVGVLATGDELVDPPGALGPGRIHDANRHALLAAVRRVGGVAVDLGIVGDDEAAIGAALEAAIGRCDVVLTSGGVSVGVADHLKSVLARCSDGSAQWMEVRIKPGKPFGFARLAPSGLPVLCLPGNPVSALVVFELLAAPVLRRLAGHPRPVPVPVTARVDEPLGRAVDGKLHLRRVVVHVDADGGYVARPIGGMGSHLLHALASANGLAMLPDGVGAQAGESVRVLLLGPVGVDGRR